MFGTNKITGKKFFTDSLEAKAGKLLVTSIFFSMQGEGPYRGKPAIFVRLAKCNLHCQFCDTSFEQGNWLTVEDILSTAKVRITDFFEGKLVPFWASREMKEIVFVVTGGEPTLQPNLKSLLLAADSEYQHTQIETNGVLKPEVTLNTVVVVSPKAREVRDVDGNLKPVTYIKPSVENLTLATCLKFVMEAGNETNPYSSVPDWALNWRDSTGADIYVSPMNRYLSKPKARDIILGSELDVRSKEEIISFWTPSLIDMEQAQRNHEYTAEYALQNGLIFNMQLHLFAGMA